MKNGFLKVGIPVLCAVPVAAGLATMTELVMTANPYDFVQECDLTVKTGEGYYSEYTIDETITTGEGIGFSPLPGTIEVVEWPNNWVSQDEYFSDFVLNVKGGLYKNIEWSLDGQINYTKEPDYSIPEGAVFKFSQKFMKTNKVEHTKEEVTFVVTLINKTQK